jgi:signal transduction histidine kinase/DNA-binding response OmpR family regulator
MTKILVVEDSATQAQELAWLLESEGLDVEVTRNGGSGLERCKQGGIDVVLSDVIMPEMDGFELCKALKSDPKTGSIPVILLTSLADPMDIVRGLECGADNFITKPYEGDYLLGRVRRLLDNIAIRSHRKVDIGVDVMLMGKRFTINSEREQILDLLISTFEEVLRSRQREYEAKLSEETLRESHRFLQSALDALSGHIAILDLSGKILSGNAQWRRLAMTKRWSWPDAGVGLPYLKLCRDAFGMDAEDSAKVNQGVQAVLSGERDSFAAEFAAWTLSDPRWFTITATRFQEREAHLVAIQHEDITARKQLEQQFHHSQKMEAIGQLAGGVAHDFNNLLTVISGYGRLAQRRIGAGPGAHELGEVERATERATQLTRQLLAFSRQQVMDPVTLDLNEVTSGLLPMLDRLIGDDVSVAVLAAGDLPPVRADRAQLERVINNLAINARDAMPTGGTLTIETASEDGYVRLAVTDTGVGMTRDVIEHIFEPFYTTKEQGQGTGLGLATVHGIVNQSGGRVTVYSEPGLGSTFRVFLPVAVREKVVRTASQNGSDGLAGTESILVCEDEEGVRRLIEVILSTEGYRVLSTAGPREALELAANGTAFDALVSDVIMPDMSGPDLAQRIKTLRPGLRTLFISGYTAETVRGRGNLPLGSAFLEKPFDQASLLRALRALLDQPAAAIDP